MIVIMRRIILASESPRRKEFFERYNMDFETIASSIDEKMDNETKPDALVMSLALQKAQDVASKVEEGIIIAADTIVYKDEVLGKPKNKEEALEVLKKLSGNSHKVFTGIAIIDKKENKIIVDFEETEVVFRELKDKEIEAYLNTNEYKDKAGSYGIQGLGEILVKEIKGSYSNVVGLPIAKLDMLLKKHFNFGLL